MLKVRVLHRPLRDVSRLVGDPEPLVEEALARVVGHGSAVDRDLFEGEERAGYEERLGSLWRMYEHLEIELETGKRPAPDFTPSAGS